MTKKSAKSEYKWQRKVAGRTPSAARASIAHAKRRGQVSNKTKIRVNTKGALPAKLQEWW